MGTATDSADDGALLTLAQWFSPAFPVGGFHFSHGLEWEIDRGEVHDAASLEEWIAEVLEHGSGRNDALLLASASRAVTEEELAGIDALARALAASRERLIETSDMGGAFARVISDLLCKPVPPLTYPVAVGRAVHLAGLPAVAAAQMYLQAFVANLASVGMRLVPVGQTDGQKIIRSLAGACAEIARATAEGDLDDLGSTTFLADIASMRHETQYSRIFRT